MANLYSKQTISHFRNPHNYGELKHPDGQGEAGNIICGDIMSLYIEVKIDKKGREIITAVKFKTYGCAAAIATSSVITDLARGKTIDEALLLSKKDIIDTLHGLPPIKIHCSLLAIDALGEAIYQYLLTHKRPIPENLSKRHGHIEQEKKIIEDRLKKLKAM
jgi:nitrogen fixation protein NifU and related proteins